MHMLSISNVTSKLWKVGGHEHGQHGRSGGLGLLQKLMVGSLEQAGCSFANCSLSELLVFHGWLKLIRFECDACCMRILVANLSHGLIAKFAMGPDFRPLVQFFGNKAIGSGLVRRTRYACASRSAHA